MSALTQLHREFPWARIHGLDYPLALDALGAVLEEIRASHESVHCGEVAGRRAARLIGDSPSMQMVQRLVAKVAQSTATVLINGESGTGKEVVARQIHSLSGRKGQFIAINCGAIPENLLEAELFGHERGAFTGAVSARAGRFEQAKGGTFFLDEIGDMPPVMQVKLLRVLEDRSIERVGGTKTVDVDVRVIAATHRDLLKRVDNGLFRQDLFYRLNVFPIEVPPLRERAADITLLIDEFNRRLGEKGAADVRFSERAMQLLESYEWPGNVRELANLVERLMVAKYGGLVDDHDIPWPINAQSNACPAVPAADSEPAPVSLPPTGIDLREKLRRIERDSISRALEETNGVVQHAARLLGMGRTTLVEKIRRLDIQHGGEPGK